MYLFLFLFLANLAEPSSWSVRSSSGNHRHQSADLLRRIVAALLIQSRFPFKRITSQYLASLFRSRRARVTLPADPAWIRQLTRTPRITRAATLATLSGGEAERDSRRARNGDRAADAPPGLDTVNKRRIRVNRVKQTRAALGNNEVTRSNCRSERELVYIRWLLCARITREIISWEPWRREVLHFRVFKKNQKSQIKKYFM